MTDRELMQQALDALEEYTNVVTSVNDPNSWVTVADGGKPAREAITALRERLAQPQMQPCAGRNCGSTNPNLHSAECFEDYEKATGMRAWQGLTDEEIDELALDENGLPNSHIEFARAIEAKLKEKNG